MKRGGAAAIGALIALGGLSNSQPPKDLRAGATRPPAKRPDRMRSLLDLSGLGEPTQEITATSGGGGTSGDGIEGELEIATKVARVPVPPPFRGKPA